MKPCDTQFLLILNFLSHRLNQPLDSSACDAESINSREILMDYVNKEINLLLWIGLVGITVILLKKFVILFQIWAYGRRIPGPPCPSFCGHSSLFSGDRSLVDLTELLVESHKKYGSTVKLWLSPTQLLVSIKDPLLIKEMLSKAADKLPLVGRVYRLAFGQSRFFVSSIEKVKRGREALAVDLNGKLLENANVMTDRVVASVMENFSAVDEGTLDCGIVSQHMAFSILGATLFGDAFFAWSKANAYEEILVKIAKDACLWASYSVPPFWRQGYWRYQHLCTKLKCLTQDIVQYCQLKKLLCQSSCNNNFKMAGAEAASDMNHTSGVEKLMKSSLDESFCPLNAREEPCGVVMGMMFHGCLTTAGLISNILARLVLHPEIQEKIYSEVIMMRRRPSNLQKLDVSEMHLLLATVYESARLLPAGPLLQRCSLRQDVELNNGLLLPAGALLVAPIQLVQTDEHSWGSDAGQFNPYRFLSKAEKISEPHKSSGTSDLEKESYVLTDPYKNAAFLPFGSGLRACIGQKFAVFGIASTFASLLENYEIKLVPESDMEWRPVMTNCVLQLIPSPKIVFVRRNA